jgi:hypothetical protein
MKRTYPVIRRPARSVSITTTTFSAETGEVTFTNTTDGTYTFKNSYTAAPNVVISPVDSESNEGANVGVNVTSITTTAVGIQATAPFTGKVSVQVMEIG